MNAGRTHRRVPSRPQTAPRQSEKRCSKETVKARKEDQAKQKGMVHEKRI